MCPICGDVKCDCEQSDGLANAKALADSLLDDDDDLDWDAADERRQNRRTESRRLAEGFALMELSGDCD